MANLEDMLNKLEEEQEKKINRTRVKEAAMEAAEDIFSEEGVDKEKVRGIVDSAIESAESTEDAIQIAINMLRSGS